jgi:ABC-type uncharacterized transport system substrate-binding protein
MKHARAALVLPLVLVSTTISAADVAILKSTDTLAWRPAIDALRRATSSHAVTEYDLRGEKAEGEKVLNALKGKAVILVAMGPLAAQLSREILPDTPLVFCMVQDPSKVGLAAAPNLTGVSFYTPAKNQLAAFRMVHPQGVRIGILYNEENVGRHVQEAQKAVTGLGRSLIVKPVASVKDVPQALREMLTGENAVDALWMLPDPMLLDDESRRFIFAETLKAGRPVYSFSSALVGEGALVSNGPDLASVGELAGDLVNRLASGEKTKIEFLVPRGELVINKKIAGKLKITISAEVLKAAARTF